MISEFKIGDHIKKVFGNLYISEKIFKIIELKEVKGGNWHDGFSISIIATIESIISNTVNPETDTEEFCIQHINYMCQVNNVFAKHVDK
jgi:hypothetical protein